MLGRATRLGFQPGLILLGMREGLDLVPSSRATEMGEQEAGTLQPQHRMGSTQKRAGITHKPCCWVGWFSFSF